VLIATNGIVLKRIPFSDTSLICRLFTKEKGKVTILAKGAQAPKKSINAFLEPINHIHIQYYHKNSRDIQLLKEAGFIKHYSTLRKNLDRIILAFTVVEMIDKCTQDDNPHPILYRLIWRVLDKLNDENQNQWRIFAFFLYHLSLRLGFMPNLSNCSKCNSTMIQGGIDKSTGELVCINCISYTETQSSNLSGLNKLISLHIDELDRFSAEKNELLDSILLLDAFLSYHIEGLNKVKSMHMVRIMLNKN
jgi:DNA repair protein RecO (recombination protein O)